MRLRRPDLPEKKAVELILRYEAAKERQFYKATMTMTTSVSLSAVVMGFRGKVMMVPANLFLGHKVLIKPLAAGAPARQRALGFTE